jgi:tRNA threonylcarbamoyladenosine biosynthesis protein TsaB
MVWCSTEQEMSAPVLLSLETATLAGSVWLGAGEVELAGKVGDRNVSQSTSLLNDIDEILTEAGLSLTDVDFFCCASGPGSFTGLRIGIATLKGLAASFGRPCIGIPTLAAVAHAAGPSQATIALLPAGRGEVFVQMFSVADVVTELDSAAHLSPSALIERYKNHKQLVWAGPAAQQHRDVIEDAAKAANIPLVRLEPALASETFWQFAEEEMNLAKHVAALALRAYSMNQLQSPRELSAIYVRPSDAELNQKCQ